MHYLGRPTSSLAILVSIIIFVTSIFSIVPARAMPFSAGTKIGLVKKSTIDNEITPRSILTRIFNDWIGGNRAQIVADVTYPHIKRWHGRKKYRGVHH